RTRRCIFGKQASRKRREMYYTHMESPVGPLLLAGDEQGLRRIGFPNRRESTEGWREDPTPFAETIRQLRAYFGGELHEFDMPLRMEGTAFQLSVWRTLRGIPYGETISYGELARR